MYIFLIWLTFWDTAILIGALLLYSIPTLLTWTYRIYAQLFPLFYMFCNAALTASVWLTLAFMIDRYKKVTKPFHKKVISLNTTPLSERRIHLFMLLLSFMAICFAMPRFFEISVDVDMTINRYNFQGTSLTESYIYVLVYRIIGGLVFYSALPYILMFVISARIWIALSEAAKKRREMTNSSYEKKNGKESGGGFFNIKSWSGSNESDVSGTWVQGYIRTFNGWGQIHFIVGITI